jgi:hypothetical protein
MNVKQIVVNELKGIIEDALPSPAFWRSNRISVRCDHGCWEVLIRRSDDAFKVFELTLAEHDLDDIWIYFDEDYDDDRCVTLKLCDPDWIDRVVQILRDRFCVGVGSPSHEGVQERPFRSA